MAARANEYALAVTRDHTRALEEAATALLADASWVVQAPAPIDEPGLGRARALLEAWTAAVLADAPSGPPAGVAEWVGLSLDELMLTPFDTGSLPDSFYRSYEDPGFDQSLGAQLFRGVGNCDGVNGLAALACRTLGDAGLVERGSHRSLALRLDEGWIELDPFARLRPFSFASPRPAGTLAFADSQSEARALNEAWKCGGGVSVSDVISPEAEYRADRAFIWQPPSQPGQGGGGTDAPSEPADARTLVYLRARVRHLAGDREAAASGYRALQGGRGPDDWMRQAAGIWLDRWERGYTRRPA